MRKRNIIILIFTVVIVGSVIASIFLTKVTPKYYTRYGVELGTNVEISYATRKGNAKEIVDKMFNEFEKYDRIFSIADCPATMENTPNPSEKIDLVETVVTDSK